MSRHRAFAAVRFSFFLSIDPEQREALVHRLAGERCVFNRQQLRGRGERENDVRFHFSLVSEHLDGHGQRVFTLCSTPSSPADLLPRSSSVSAGDRRSLFLDLVRLSQGSRPHPIVHHSLGLRHYTPDLQPDYSSHQVINLCWSKPP